MQNEFNETPARTTPMTTIYTIHAARDHKIEAHTANADKLADRAQAIANIDLTQNEGKATRYYVSNGTGIVAAFMTKNGAVHEVLRNDYLKFKDAALAERAKQNIA